MSTPTTSTEQRVMTDALLAIDHEHHVYVVDRFESYADAIIAWNAHDEARLAGRRPHVKHYEVRATDDPKTLVARRSGVAVPSRFLRDAASSRGFGKAEDAARVALRLRFPTRPDGGPQGSGGWFYDATRPLAQGLRGIGGLVDVAQRRGWIAQGAGGRWYPLVAEARQ